jgi:hypothetical protein
VETLSLPKVNSRWRMLIHGLGLASLGTAIILQSIVFLAILSNGYFRAVEQNSVVLSVEIVFTGLAAVYFVYILASFFFSHKQVFP